MTTIYAIRILCYLHLKENQLTSAAEMSSELGIGYQYLMKVINQLRIAELVESTQGCRGGFRLARSASDISIYDIIRAIEGDICIMPCLENDTYCVLHDSGDCTVNKIFRTLQEHMFTRLHNKNLSDLVSVAT